MACAVLSLQAGRQAGLHVSHRIVTAWVHCGLPAMHPRRVLTCRWRMYRQEELQFMEPLRDFQFRGVPHRTTATLVPYVDCLVEITEMPFTVLTIADINIANLERVGFGLRNFDLTFVFKVR